MNKEKPHKPIQIKQIKQINKYFNFNSISLRTMATLFVVILVEAGFFLCFVNIFSIFADVDNLAAATETLHSAALSVNVRERLYLCILLSVVFAALSAIFIAKKFSKPVEKMIADAQNGDPMNSVVLERANMAIFEWSETTNHVYITKHFFPLLDEPDTELYITGFIPANVFKAKISKIENFFVADYSSENSKVFHLERGTNASKWLKLNLVNEGNRNVGFMEDITDEMLRKNKMEFERDYDVLTSLLNRRAFHDNLQTVFSAPQDLKIGAMLSLDLDNLKFMNDTCGHDYGDQYIRALANVLNSTYTNNAVIARFGGDEFSVFLFGYQSKDDIRTEIIRLNIAIKNQLFTLPNGQSTNLSASMGISWYPSDSSSPEQLIKYSDFAMYSAKKTVKGSYAEFVLKDYNQEAYLLGISEHLDEFIKNKMFEYTFQPIISAKNGAICAYEAFLKSKHPAIKNPKQLLALAKTKADFYELERLTWTEALTAFEQLNTMSSTKLFINSVSDQMLSSEDQKQIERNFCHLLKQVVVEITNGDRANFDCTKSKLDFLKNWGGQIALGDYGTGTYNQECLSALAPKFLKIDILLTQNLYRDDNRLNLVKSIISFAHKNGIKIIAEGIEKPEDMFTLIDIGADYLQGYHICKPSANPPKMLAITTAQIVNHNKRKNTPLAKEA